MTIGGVDCSRVVPPYITQQPLASFREWVPAPGEVLLLSVTDPASMTSASLRQLARSIRLDFAVTLGLQLPDIGSVPSIGLASRAAAIGFKVLTTTQHDLRSVLHRELAHVIHIGEDVADAVLARGRITYADASFIGEFCSAAERSQSLRHAYKLIHCPERTLREKFAVRGLPSPDRWFQLVRLLRVQYRLITEPGLTAHRAAREADFGNGQSLDNAIRRNFGVSAARSRTLLGMEWRVDMWWKRAHQYNARRRNPAADRVAAGPGSGHD